MLDQYSTSFKKAENELSARSIGIANSTEFCYLFGNYMIIQVTQMVHDLREQVVPQRFEDLRQKMVQVARRHPAATNLNRQFDRRASSERSSDLTRTTSPQFIVDSLLLSSHSLVIM
ncbi:hypothetical protein KIN20_015347 [Parelaphostrongylus tenuis]|uniref:Uncharacterized protein n=1 Tax=Parelaphostrongylus tenuis TaxID=148309 RepID=A0AAD5MFY6_PARTN|nr:hypothetical protein KIN20_015347 [Parelaphostrongylus tenuis]